MTDCLLVMTTLPDMEASKKMAHQLLESGLAACINIIPAMTSLYIWEGKTCEGTEHLLLIKTQTHSYAALETLVRSQHPYHLPEIIAMAITHGLPDYLGWIKERTPA